MISISLFSRQNLHKFTGEIDKRVQYTIEQLFAVRKEGFKENPPVKPELDLVDIEDQITHEDLTIDEAFDPQDRYNFFHPDDKFLVCFLRNFLESSKFIFVKQENEATYEELRKEILGDEVIDELEGRAPQDGTFPSLPIIKIFCLFLLLIIPTIILLLPIINTRFNVTKNYYRLLLKFIKDTEFQ